MHFRCPISYCCFVKYVYFEVTMREKIDVSAFLVMVAFSLVGGY